MHIFFPQPFSPFYLQRAKSVRLKWRKKMREEEEEEEEDEREKIQ